MSLALLGKKFALVGTFSIYQYQVKDLIAEHGGEVVEFVDGRDAKKVYCVIGERTSEQERANNKRWQWLSSMGAKSISEGTLEMMIREGYNQDERIAKREAVIAQDRLNNDDYGAW